MTVPLTKTIGADSFFLIVINTNCPGDKLVGHVTDGSIPVAVRSKAKVCDRLINIRIASSNTA